MISEPAFAGLTNVAWSDDGQTLFAAGGTYDTENRDLVFAWDRGGLRELNAA